MKQVRIQSKTTDKILSTMQVLASMPFCKTRQDKTNIFVTALTYYPDKQVMVGTDAQMMLIWKVNDMDLLKALSIFKETSWFRYKAKILEQVPKPGVFSALNYRNLIPVFDSYAKLEELDMKVMDELGIDKPLQLLEYACICARTRFKLIHFERMAGITKEWNTMEFLKNQEERPVMLKANKLRLMALVMPLRKDRIKIYDK